MGELNVRRNRGFAVPRYQGTGKTEKQSGSSSVRQTAGKAGVTVSETLRQLMARMNQAAGQTRTAQRALQTGEAVLAEVDDNLGNMENLAREAAGDGDADRAALQTELEKLRDEIDRITQDGADSPYALLDTMLHDLTRQDGAQGVPSWLTRALTTDTPDRAALLAALGLDSSASGPELLEALRRLPLEDSPTAGYLASLYLGAVIAGAESEDSVNTAQAAEGLRQLLEMLDNGISPDEAIQTLTQGKFASLADFEQQFTGGTAPGLQPFLVDLLLTGDLQIDMPFLPGLLAGDGEGQMDLLMNLLASLEGSGLALPEAAEGESAASSQAAEGEAGPQLQSMELETVQVTGRDLSSVTHDPRTNVLTLAGNAETILRGLEQETPALRLTGEGPVHLQQAQVPLLTVESAQARLSSEGETVLSQVQLADGTTLTLEGDGLVRMGALRGGAHSMLRLTGGAVVLEESQKNAQTVPVVVDGPVSLLAEGVAVQNAQGDSLSPFDIMWKLLLPEWNAINALAVDGKQGRLSLLKEENARLWLQKGDPSHGYPAHRVVLQGRDQAGRLRTRYVYLRWNMRTGGFEEISMYPNPFTVTGGEADRDWLYDGDMRTLYILSDEVDSIAGGTGMDANQLPFSGRIVLADGIGKTELTLGGVECRVSSGRAFSLGAGNSVTLLLQSGSENIFESGPGCAGISLGDGTSLRIDQAKDGAPGSLTATGGSGCAGIGRDSGAGRELAGSILICDGVVTASGARDGVEKAPPPPAADNGDVPPRFHISASSLHLNDLDLSTRETARAAMETLAAGRKRVVQMKRACTTLYGQLEQSARGLHGMQRYIRGVRSAEEADALLWDMRETLSQSPLAAFSPWDLDDLGTLLW